MPDTLRYIEKYIEFRYYYDYNHEDAIRYAARETYARACAKTAAPRREPRCRGVYTHTCLTPSMITPIQICPKCPKNDFLCLTQLFKILYIFIRVVSENNPKYTFLGALSQVFYNSNVWHRKFI